MWVKAYDPAYPDDYAVAPIYFNVNRNEYPPEFNQAAYVVTINETEAVGTVILTVSATDRNTRVCFYMLML